jgi:dipeptidyl aminopeptidase/acylaminoacyl peptidase
MRRKVPVRRGKGRSNGSPVATATIVLVVLLTRMAMGQGGREDYQRAAALREVTQNKVCRDRVTPNWLSDNERFWYRIEIGAQRHEYWLVDASQGEQKYAFDHARLAEALQSAGVEDARADRLPLRRVTLDPDAQRLVFRSGDAWWQCDLSSYALTPHEPIREPSNAISPNDAPRASRATGSETEITFVNRSEGVVEVFWLDTRGRRRSYGTIDPGAEHRQHTYAGHVWLAVNDRGEELAVFVAEEQPVWAEINGHVDGTGGSSRGVGGRARRRDTSPDGKWQALSRDGQLILRDTANGEESLLARPTKPNSSYQQRFYWSRDSQKLVAVCTTRGQERKVFLIESAPEEQLQPKLHSYDYLKPGDKIDIDQPYLFDVSQRKPIPLADDLFRNPWRIGSIRWAPDAASFTFVYNQRGHQRLRVISVDAQSGAARAVVEERSDTFVDYHGKQFLHVMDATGELIWMSERDGWNHLYLYDMQTGEVKHQITSGPWVVRGVERVDEKARQIWFRAGGIRPGHDPYYVHFCRVNFDGSNLVVLTESEGSHEIEFSPDRRLFLDRWSRVDMPPRTELRRASDGSLVLELQRADWSELLATTWRAPERFVATGRDGKTPIYGVLFRPSNFDPHRTYPVVEEIYAGPQGAFVPKTFRAFHGAQAVAELGFVVVKIDGMGTSHRSKAFHDVCWRNLSDSGLPDRICWIRALAEKYPFLDLSRVGIYGGSAGGQSALSALLHHGDFYHVAVADCGCHDNRMDKIWWNELWMGWPIGPHYAEQSNATHANQLQGKLLLIVGELDRNVDPASTMQVVDALVKADKDFDMLVLPGVGHGAAETPYGNRRRQDFLVRHLLGVEPRWESNGE